ncbi:hypothetical protein ACVWXO_005633 [Bradyrhizobium sp. LM2.7]
MECLEGIFEVRQTCTQAGDFELRGGEIRLQVVALGFINSGIQLDQNVSRFDRLPVANMNGPNHPNFEGLDDLSAF